MSNRAPIQKLFYNASLGEASITEAIARLEKVEFEGKGDVLLLLKSGLSIATLNEHLLSSAAGSCGVSGATDFPYVTYRVPPVVLAHLEQSIKTAEEDLARDPDCETNLKGLKTLMHSVCDKSVSKESIQQAFSALDQWTLQVVSDTVVQWIRQL